MARLWELESELDSYKRAMNNTTSYGKGARHGFRFAIQLVMKYRHKLPGLTEDEVEAALIQLRDAKAFISVKKENLPVPA